MHEALAVYRAVGLDWRAKQLDRAYQPTAAPPEAPNVFRYDGDLWTLAYQGTVVHVQDVKGLHDLATLLAHPGREFHALDLVSAPAAAPGAATAEGVHEQGHAGALIDEQARRGYQRRLADLEAELAEAQSFGDDERSARLTAERDALVGELARAYGLGGRARRAGDPTERARSAVTWRIRSGVKRIERAHPALGRHLARSVRTGTFCSYSPETPVVWRSGT